MPEQLAAAEPYTTRFVSRVARSSGTELELDRTYFYAESGGQPADRGTVAGEPVVDVRIEDGRTVHELSSPPAVTTGDRVDACIDRRFRAYCMRAHTASHVLYGAGRRLLDDIGYGGFGIDERKVRIDLATTSSIDDGTLVELERLANRVVWESRPVDWTTVSTEAARNRDDVAFNTKTEEGVFDRGTGVRIVEIGRPIGRRGSADEPKWDAAACGGTHVRNTREIGPIAVLDRSNPGEGLTRIELAVGPRAIEHRLDVRSAAMESAARLETGVADLPAAVERLRRKNAELIESRTALNERLVDIQLKAMAESGFERDGSRWLVGAIECDSTDVLADRARTLAGDVADIVAFVGRDGDTVLTVASDGSVHAGEVVDSVTSRFGGGGGGGPPFAQAGGIDVDPEAVVSFLRP